MYNNESYYNRIAEEIKAYGKYLMSLPKEEFEKEFNKLLYKTGMYTKKGKLKKRFR